MILLTEGSTEEQASEAEKVMAILCATYPGHPWAVRVGKGFIFIRHLQRPGNWGMNIKTGKDDWSASNLKKKVIMAAGEWLERAGLSRGRENGDEIVSVEGVPFEKTADFQDIRITSDYRDALHPIRANG